MRKDPGSSDTACRHDLTISDLAPLLTLPRPPWRPPHRLHDHSSPSPQSVHVQTQQCWGEGSGWLGSQHCLRVISISVWRSAPRSTIITKARRVRRRVFDRILILLPCPSTYLASLEDMDSAVRVLGGKLCRPSRDLAHRQPVPRPMLALTRASEDSGARVPAP